MDLASHPDLPSQPLSPWRQQPCAGVALWWAHTETADSWRGTDWKRFPKQCPRARAWGVHARGEPAPGLCTNLNPLWSHRARYILIASSAATGATLFAVTDVQPDSTKHADESMGDHGTLLQLRCFPPGRAITLTITSHRQVILHRAAVLQPSLMVGAGAIFGMDHLPHPTAQRDQPQHTLQPYGNYCCPHKPETPLSAPKRDPRVKKPFCVHWENECAQCNPCGSTALP